MPRQTDLKILPLPAICGLLFLLCAANALAAQARVEQDLSVLPDQSFQSGLPTLSARTGDRQMAASRERGSGFYLSPRFLCQWQNHVDRMTIAVNGVSASDGVFHSRQTAGFALAAGHDFWSGQKWPLRAELELALRGDSHYSRQASYQAGRQSEIFKSRCNVTTLLTSFYYDYHNETNFVPYIGAGVGLAFVYGGFDYQAKVAGEEFRASGSQTFINFVWTVGSGISWQISDQIAIDLGYRYLDPGKIEFSGIGKFGPAKVSYQAEDLSHIHEISLGLRFCF